MKLWDIVKTVGSGIIKTAVPGGGMIIDMVNGFLPDDKKLPNTATGNDVNNAIANLPPEQQATIMSKELDVELTQIKESNSTVRAMLDSDAQNPHTTRPYIAKNSFHVIAFVIVVTISLWSYGIIKQDAELIAAVMDGWPFVMAVVGPLVTLLWAYFGVLKQEHKNKLDAANGASTPTGITGILSTLLTRK